MSRATLYVLFPDGAIRFGLYNGTTDVCCAPLYATVDEAWDTYDLTAADGEGPGWAVQMATDYGDGSWWTGLAQRDRVISPSDLWGEEVDVHEGLPDWMGQIRNHELRGERYVR
jgi:hypothetical protein